MPHSFLCTCLQGTYAQGYGAVLDSGTTFTYLPSAAFAPFLAAVKDHALSHGLQMTEGPDKNVRPFSRGTVLDGRAGQAPLPAALVPAPVMPPVMPPWHLCCRSVSARVSPASFPFHQQILALCGASSNTTPDHVDTCAARSSPTSASRARLGWKPRRSCMTSFPPWTCALVAAWCFGLAP